ncbi:MAG: efflux RND transporter periplasmic adaptor subunit [Mucilaginibacter polytrichastri]|nr:efflux RND transporter periplasmic adaptor subunit [Mucilaginibacter polytrichastri]
MKRLLFYSLFTLLFSACGQADKPAGEESAAEETADTTLVKLTDTQMKNAGIRIAKPEFRTVNNTLRLQGSIDVPPQSTVSVSFPLGGYLKSTDLLPGMHVRKGQVLGVLEDMQFIQLQQDYLSMKEKLRFAETEFARQKELNESKASSDKVFQQARAEMETLKIGAQALARKLELIGINPYRLNAAGISKTVNIRSPIDGFVAHVNVNIGKYTSPTDVLFELVNPKDIHLALTVFEKDLNQLAIGQKVWAYSNQDPAKKYEAEIILITKNLNQDRSAEVHCHFEKFDPKLLPGMFMNAEVELGNQRALAVKEDAVVRWQDKYYVFLADGKNSFRMKPVTTGAASGGYQQVNSPGLDSASGVVQENAYALLMQMKNSGEEED